MEAVKQIIGRIEWIRRYSAGPFPEERNAYLAHLQKIGHSVRRMRDVNRFLLGIAEQIDLSRADLLDVAQIRQAGEAWVSSHCKPHSTARTRQLALREFTYIGERWLRFLGKLRSPECSHVFQKELELFLIHLKDERGYTEQTLLTRSTALSLFFNWLTARGSLLEEVRAEAVAAYFVENKDKCWSRATIAVYAQTLRSFFRYLPAGAFPASVQGLKGHISTRCLESLKGPHGRTCSASSRTSIQIGPPTFAIAPSFFCLPFTDGESERRPSLPSTTLIGGQSAYMSNA